MRNDLGLRTLFILGCLCLYLEYDAHFGGRSRWSDPRVVAMYAAGEAMLEARRAGDADAEQAAAAEYNALRLALGQEARRLKGHNDRFWRSWWRPADATPADR